VAPGDEVGAWVVDHDLYVAARDGEPRRITTDGGDDVVYGGAAHRAEFGISDGLWWGPAGRRLAFSREDMHPIAPYPYADFRTQPPALVHGRYPMAGRRHSVVQIGVYDAETRDPLSSNPGKCSAEPGAGPLIPDRWKAISAKDFPRRWRRIAMAIFPNRCRLAIRSCVNQVSARKF
jgi:hypothetical protein